MSETFKRPRLSANSIIS